MKKILLVVAVAVLSVFAAGAAFAAARENVGCGLGTMLFKDAADDSMILQALQATTNGLFGTQTFGLTSGTSECRQPAKFANNEKLNHFVVANMDNLAKDISRGSGETLEAFADLMQVPAEERPEFYQKLQGSFAKIFTSENVVLAEVVDNAVSIRSAD